jgi:hypothetical protein
LRRYRAGAMTSVPPGWGHIRSRWPMCTTSFSRRASSPRGSEACSCSSPIWSASTSMGLATGARLPGSGMIPAGHALRASLALKLWSIERKSHVMALVADEGLALFCGLNAVPKKSFLSEYSSRITPQNISRLLALWHARVTGEPLLTGQSLNLDFHSVPYFGEYPLVQSHYLSKRSRRQPSILTFLAQDADSQVFCYSNADIRKGEETEEVFRFIAFWKRQHGSPPQHLVFDSKLTTYQGLDRLDAAGITFLTLRRRAPKLLAEIDHLPPSAWRTITLDMSHRKYRTPRIYEQKTCPRERTFRQFFIKDLGHDEPTILLTNDRSSTPSKIIARYARRMLIENALSDAVRFFHIDALSSSVGFKSTSIWPSLSSPPASTASWPTACEDTATLRRVRYSAISSICQPMSPSRMGKSRCASTGAPISLSSLPPGSSINPSPSRGGKGVRSAWSNSVRIACLVRAISSRGNPG